MSCNTITYSRRECNLPLLTDNLVTYATSTAEMMGKPITPRSNENTINQRRRHCDISCYQLPVAP
jgi:hypothetical protein